MSGVGPIGAVKHGFTFEDGTDGYSLVVAKVQMLVRTMSGALPVPANMSGAQKDNRALI